MGGLKGGQIGGQKDAEIDDIKELTHRQKEVLKLAIERCNSQTKS